MFTGTQRFCLVAQLGQGSMGVVYRVHDAETDSEVALKTLSTRDPEQVYHLKQEFRALTDIVHPNLVELYELVVDDVDCFFTMELIDGVHFVQHVCGVETAVDLRRFADAARQLVMGLAAVHAAGKLHRDVKPSNVLVTREGRVVLLDFGLATALGVSGAYDADSGSAAGTLAYMAPELLLGGAPSPSADWYSVGVVLYEAATGQLPYAGPPTRVAREKMQSPPPRASRLAAALPDHLDALIAALLDSDAARRPGAGEILDRLSAATSAVVGVAPAPPPFVGRAEELAELHAIFERVRGGHAAVVHLLGPSGIGKSELARRFLAHVEQDGHALVLSGRCHPQEAVPYKAVDRLVDALSRALIARPEPEIAALAPAHAAALARLFPVLARVPALARRDERDDAAEPHEVRRRGFGALRELFGRLAARQSLVLWIDDLQWGDLDSAALLRELLRPPDAPALLMLLSYRSEDREHMPLPDLSDAAELPREWAHEIQLGPLSSADTEELAKRLCAAQIGSDRRLAEIVAESAGSPFFVAELARSASAADPTATLRLADVMHERFRQLGGAARNVLEVVSVAGGPVLRSVALAAAGMGERGRPIIQTLEHRSLLRTTTVNEQAAIEVYHDRIREALLAQLAPIQLSALHGRIAESLRLRPDADPHALSTHYFGAGDTVQAGHYAVLAGDRAAAALAFDRAARLYRQALELGGSTTERPVLLQRLGEALENAGRGKEAADAFADAARAGEAGADGPQQIDLWRRAAGLYLRSGHLAQGVSVTRDVLDAVGVAFPRSPLRALQAALRLRLRLGWRGWRFESRPADAIPPPVKLRLDACWGAAIALTLVDQGLSDALAVRHLLEALDAGAQLHLSHALGLEVAKSVQFGGRFLRRAASLLGKMEQLVETAGGPYERAQFHLVRAAVAYHGAGWRAALEHGDIASRILRRDCRGVSWEIATTDAFAFSALAHMGEFRELGRRLPDAIRDADDRGDLYAAAGFRNGVPNLLWLAQDRPAYALQQAEEGMARWPASETFQHQHYLHLIAVVHAALYRRDVWCAWAQITAAWPRLRKALFLALGNSRVELRNLRARAALACAATPAAALAPGATPPDPAWPCRHLLRLATQEARRLAHDTPIASAAPFAILIRAGVTDTNGGADEARQLYARAAAGFAEIDMGLYAAAARCRAAVLFGESGDDQRRDSIEWMRAQDIQNPVALAAVCCPAAFSAPAPS